MVDDVDVERLRGFVAMAAERTMEQDPMFAFRIEEVDIAIKALSPAINDPTTAVLAIDQLNRMLRMVGRRSLQDHEVDNQGQPRVVFPNAALGRLCFTSASGKFVFTVPVVCRSSAD